MTPFLKNLTATVAARYGVDAAMILSPSRRAELCRARSLIWAIARWQSPRIYTTTRLGQYFRRDHTTVMMALRRHGQPRFGRQKRFRQWPAGLLDLCASAGWSLRASDIAAQIGCPASTVADARRYLRDSGAWGHGLKAPPYNHWAAIAARQGTALRTAD